MNDPHRPVWRRFLPIAAIVGGLAAFYALGLNRYAGFDALREHRETFNAFVGREPAQAALLYVAAYAVVVALSLPGGAVLTVLGGFLFGLYLGTGLAVTGATVGSLGIFLACRTAFGGVLRAKAGPALRRMEDGFRRNALSYLLVLRLVPLFPFWLVNLVPAFLGVSLRTFFIGTALGIVPGTFVFTSIGSGLGAVLDAGGTPDLTVLFRAEVLTPILGLAALSLLPVAYKTWRGKASS